MYVQQKLVE